MWYIIIYSAVFLFFFGWIIYSNLKQPTYNSIVFRHPDNGGGAYKAKLEPAPNHLSWYFRYSKLSFKARPLWIWQEFKSKTSNPGLIYGVAPYEPISPASLTSEALYSDIDWDDAKFYMSCQSKWMEGIKFGLAILMVLVCIFGLMIMVDMLGK